jgi:hypothetical protein
LCTHHASEFEDGLGGSIHGFRAGASLGWDGCAGGHVDPEGAGRRISTLKHGYGWDRARIDATEGANIWTGHGVLAHNLVKISAPTA